MFIEYRGDVPVTDVSAKDVQRWFASLDKLYSQKDPDKPLSAWTKDSYGRAVRAYFNTLVRTKHIEAPGPSAELKMKRLPRKAPKDLSDEEINLLVQHSADNVRNHAIILVLRDTGCRVSGLESMLVSSVEIAEIDRELEGDEAEIVELARVANATHLIHARYLRRLRGKLLVTEKGQMGRRKQRYVFFGHECAKALLAYMDLRPAGSPDELWLNHHGRAMKKGGIYYAVKSVSKLAGIEASPHRLRHSFANKLRRNGADLRITAELMGHSDPMTTARQYWIINDREMEEAHEKYLYDE